MSFLDTCIAASIPVWEACLQTPFLQALADGTLDGNCFLGYLVDDSLYLREYAKVFAWGILRSNTMEDIRTCYSLLSFVNEGEGATRLFYLHRYGLKDEDIQLLPQRPENKAYTSYMLEAARNGGMAECMMACLPCMISYLWIFQTLKKRNPFIENTPYWPLVRDYIDSEYEKICRQWINYTDHICAELSDHSRQHCIEIFKACSIHELHFWEMSGTPRSDLPQIS